MGGLAAVLQRDGKGTAAVVTRMLEASPHRGEIDEVLVHGRCAIGIQNQGDFRDADIWEGEGLLCAFQGRLDNLDDLIWEIRRSGRPPDGTGPAAVIGAAFRLFGDEAPKRFRGMFTALVTDGEKVRIFRDHLAFGQIFVRQEPRALYAASEPKQVVAGAGIPSEPDVDVVEGYFYADVEDETPCALKGVRRIPKATLVVSDGERARFRRYWDPESLLETARLSSEEIQERFDELMSQSTARMLTGSDVVSLSGGVDSPGVAAYAAPRHQEMTGRPIAALSMIFPDVPSSDESMYIKLTAEALGMPLHTYTPEAGPLTRIAEWVRLCDGPSPVNSPGEAEEYYRHARRLGARNILDGNFVEFLLARTEGITAHLLLRRQFRALALQIHHRRAAGTPWKPLLKGLISPFLPGRVLRARERSGRNLGDVELADWIDHSLFLEVNARRWFVHPRERWRREQTSFFVGPGIGVEADAIVQSATGVRVRRPWVDVDLVEFLLTLPAQVKFPDRNAKTFERSLLRGKVPNPILDRLDKTYFNEHLLGSIDYPVLRKLLIHPAHRIRGVDYERLAEHLYREDLTIRDYKLAIDLAKSHAFLALWE
jgi:asparagine synthase (glutamine-hydrolysing)